MTDDPHSAASRGVRWLVSGRVQGVGFRFHVYRAARRHGVRGEVRNLHDGRVEIRAAGTSSAVERLLEDVRRGPPGADVVGIDAYELETTERFAGFEIRLQRTPGRPIETTMRVNDLKKTIREIPDFPKPGITFYDLSTLFRDAEAFRAAVDKMEERFRGEPIDALAAIEARGFILGAALAYRLGVGTILLRKEGKLPAEKEGESYTLEYGEATIEMHRDAVSEGQRVVVVDDLLATGGTAAAAGRLVERLGGRLEGYAFLVELDFLDGRKALGESAVFSLIHYDR